MRKLSIILLIIISFIAVDAQPPRPMGLNFDDAGYQQVKLKAPLVRSLYTNLPSSASLKMYCPEPKSQGNYGTCVGWSTTYAALTIVDAMQKNLTNKATITDNAFAPGFTYKLTKESDDHSCSFGTYIDQAFENMKQYGGLKYKDFDISCPVDIAPDLYIKAAQNKILDYAAVFGLFDGNNFKIEATKKSLAENKPVVIGMKCPPSFFEASGVWTPAENFNDNFGGHAMCVIGYDDNMYGGAFEIQNSWGIEWGNQGYIWIRYQDFANFTKYAYELIGKVKQNPGTKNTLAGEVKYQLRGGSNMTASFDGKIYQMKGEYKSGTLFRLYISNNEPAFVYAIGTDMTQKLYPVFPHLENISPALTYKQNDVAIPDETHYIQMDKTIGTDYLCVLYSLKPLDIETIKTSIIQASGSFYEKVQKALAAEMVETSAIQYFSDGRIGFDASSMSKNVVPLFVAIKHVE